MLISPISIRYYSVASPFAWAVVRGTTRIALDAHDTCEQISIIKYLGCQYYWLRVTEVTLEIVRRSIAHDLQ